jgi:hypothetical protein
MASRDASRRQRPSPTTTTEDGAFMEPRRSQPVATDRKWDSRENGSNRRKPLRWGCERLPWGPHGQGALPPGYGGGRFPGSATRGRVPPNPRARRTRLDSNTLKLARRCREPVIIGSSVPPGMEKELDRSPRPPSRATAHYFAKHDQQAAALLPTRPRLPPSARRR